jgi:hypothetical protein
MSRSRMFGDDEPKNPSPRTTIVGGQPPGHSAELPPVPTGIQRLLRLASVDPAFARELGARRAEMGAAAGIELTASERAILQAIPAAQLQAMIAGLPPPEEDRRTFLRQSAASAVVLLGGALLGPACPVRGSRSDVPPEPAPPRPDEPAPVPAGARIDVPPQPPPPASAPAEPAPPRLPVTQPMRGTRPNRPQMHTAGVRPDRDHVPRPERTSPTRGATVIEPFKDGKIEDFDKK